MLYIAPLLALIALALLWYARQRRRALGLPGGRIIYSDTTRWQSLEEPLYDAGLRLTGRPDYLVRDRNAIIPVEVKSSRVSASPYDSHVFQLAAYCRLVESAYGTRPPYGIVHYRNRTFAVDYTPALEEALLELLEEMRLEDRRKENHRSHESPGRCRRCGYNNLCEEKIA